MKATQVLWWMVLVAVLAGCGREEAGRALEAGSGRVVLDGDGLGMAHVGLDTLDTVVHFDDLGAEEFRGPALTQAIARETVHRHFKAQGYFVEGQLPEHLTDEDFLKLVVSYDTTWLVPINGNANPDGVVSYWLMLPYSSGRCWLQDRALIVDAGRGYRIVHEDFLPREFVVQRVEVVNGRPMVVGMDRDCNENVTRRMFRMRL